MPGVELQPIAKHEEAMLSYLDINFRRIADVLASLANTEQGIQTVTGSVTIDTGIGEIYNVFATLNSAPTANACLIRAYPVGSASPSDITIEVYDNVFALSTVATDVAWFALGK